MGTLTPAPLLPAPGQVSLIHDHALPVIPSPTTPCAPVFRQCFLLRAGLASDSLCVAIGGSSDFALLRQSHQSHQAVSSLCRNPWLGCSSTDYPFTSSCSPPRVATTQLLSVSGGKLRHRGTLTLLCTLTLKRTEASPLSRLGPRDPNTPQAQRDASPYRPRGDFIPQRRRDAEKTDQMESLSASPRLCGRFFRCPMFASRRRDAIVLKQPVCRSATDSTLLQRMASEEPRCFGVRAAERSADAALVLPE